MDNLAVDVTSDELDIFKTELRSRIHDQEWRLNNLYWIVNEKGEAIRFIMNQVQKELYLNLWYMDIILKSRQHGITTFACIFFLDSCLFIDNTRAAIIAHNRDDAEEFFDRNIKFAYNNLDYRIRNVISANQDSRRKLSFSNGSSLRVTTSGRSGNFQLVHISELGKIAAKYPEKAREIRTGTLNAVHPGQFVIIESTAEGRDGDFYTMCQKAEKAKKSGSRLTKMDFKFFFFAWYKNPLNVLDEEVVLFDHHIKYFKEVEDRQRIKLTKQQKAWYVKKWDVQGDDMKREHPSTPEEAFEASVMGAYFRRQFTEVYKRKAICSVPYQPGTLVDTWWDLGMRDSMCVWFTQDIGREVHVIRYYEHSDEHFSWYVEHVLDKFTKDYGYRYGRHGAPHDIRVREMFGKGKTRFEEAAKQGVKFEIADNVSLISSVDAARKKFPICWFDETNCTMEYAGRNVGLPSLENYRKEWNEKLSSYRDDELHDWASHGAAAFRTFGMLHQFRSPMGEMYTAPGPGERRNRDRAHKDGWT